MQDFFAHFVERRGCSKRTDLEATKPRGGIPEGWRCRLRGSSFLASPSEPSRFGAPKIPTTAKAYAPVLVTILASRMLLVLRRAVCYLLPDTCVPVKSSTYVGHSAAALYALDGDSTKPCGGQFGRQTLHTGSSWWTMPPKGVMYGLGVAIPQS